MLPNQGYDYTYTGKYGLFQFSGIAEIPPHDVWGIDLSRLLTISQAESMSARGDAPTSNDPVILVNDPQKYGYVSNMTINLTVALTDTLILPEPSTTRTFLSIQNLSLANNLFVSFGAAPTLTNGFKLFPGGSILMDSFVAQDDIHIMCDVAPLAGVLLYSNKGQK